MGSRIMPTKRKVGSGRKRHPGSLSSTDYMCQLENLQSEWRANMTDAEKEEFTKKKRQLKNRLSAMKSRERKRAKVNKLEQTVAQLTAELKRLQDENSQLKQLAVQEHRYSGSDSYHFHKKNENTDIHNPTKRIRGVDEKVDQSNFNPLVPKSSIPSSVESFPCAHHDSAVIYCRSPKWTAQYTLMLGVMTWKALHSRSLMMTNPTAWMTAFCWTTTFYYPISIISQMIFSVINSGDVLSTSCGFDKINKNLLYIQ